MIDIIVTLSVGIAIGYGIAKNRPTKEVEDPKDLSYYKNLSESLLADVRRLREELRWLKNG